MDMSEPLKPTDILDFVHQCSSDDFYLDIDKELPTEWISNIVSEVFDKPAWFEKPIIQWENKDVLDFVYSETSEVIVDHRPVDLSQFSSISGYIFETLNEDYCKILSKSTYIGHKIYKAKEKYIKETKQRDEDIFPIPFSGTDWGIEDLDEEDAKTKPAKKIGGPRARPLQRLGTKRTEKLWEFIIHLLQEPATCPDLIRWENFEEGTFKFVKSDKVARLWGSRKSNSNMTYEKFSRAMRYYYKSQVLLPVPGKRLVYKFGPYATGWNAVPPIY